MLKAEGLNPSVIIYFQAIPSNLINALGQEFAYYYHTTSIFGGKRSQSQRVSAQEVDGSNPSGDVSFEKELMNNLKLFSSKKKDGSPS